VLNKFFLPSLKLNAVYSFKVFFFRLFRFLYMYLESALLLQLIKIQLVVYNFVSIMCVSMLFNFNISRGECWKVLYLHLYSNST